MSSEFISYATPLLWHGLQITLLLTVLGTIVAMLAAFVAGLGRLSDHWPIRLLAVGFIELFRGSSLVVQLFFLFYALPAFGVELSPLLAGVLALGLNEGAYAAEIVRGAIVGRTTGQNEACIALNMGKTLRMRRVLIPQSIPAMLPPFGNVMIDLAKNSSLVSFITVKDLTTEAGFVRNDVGQTTTVYLILLVLYFALSQLISLLSKWLERRFALERTSRSVLRASSKRATVGGKPV